MALMQCPGTLASQIFATCNTCQTACPSHRPHGSLIQETYWNAGQANQKCERNRVTNTENDETVQNIFVELHKAGDSEVGG